MDLHLVGGFLGSGKTTAILQACKRLAVQGKKAGVITNDQGKYLVDTAFFQWNNIPAVDVTGGCFCCNYQDLERSLDRLISQVNPDVIFAESVGSCGDLVATVVKPLQALSASGVKPASFSVFTDIRLLELRLKGEELPFSDEVVYIFDKQIEEAPLLVINKADLVPPDQAEGVKHLAAAAYPTQSILLLNALDEKDAGQWLGQISAGKSLAAVSLAQMDYDRYGAGEARLAWLDEEMMIRAAPGEIHQVVREFLAGVLERIHARRAGIGHIKLILRAGGQEQKVSITTTADQGWQEGIQPADGSEGSLLLNARVEMDPDPLCQLVGEAGAEAAKKHAAAIQGVKVDCFKPGYPRPRHRMA